MTRAIDCVGVREDGGVAVSSAAARTLRFGRPMIDAFRGVGSGEWGADRDREMLLRISAYDGRGVVRLEGEGVHEVFMRCVVCWLALTTVRACQ